MRPEANRLALRAAWAIAVALWAVALWMWFDIRGATVAPPPAAVAAASPAKPPPVFVAERQRPTPVDRPAMAASAPPARALPQAVCGFDTPSGAAPSESEVEAYLARQRQAGLQRAIDALQARGGVQPLAMALLLEVSRIREQAEQRMPVVACQPGADCDAKRKGLVDSAYVQAPLASDRLLELARNGDDPWVVQLGLLACDLQFNAPKGCSALSPRRLTQLDPDNAAAWLELATRETSGQDEALFRASQASRYDSRWGQLAARIDEAMPPDMPALQRLTVVEHASGLMSAYGVSGSLTANRYCSDAAVRDANRAQLCNQLARTMVQRSPGSLDMMLGHAIGARLGWPAEQRHALRDAVQAASVLTTKATPGDAPYACAAVDAQLKQLHEAQRAGELVAAQRAIERSGLSVAELLGRTDARPARAVAGLSTPAPGSAPASR
jgi:hypothetical protein